MTPTVRKLVREGNVNAISAATAAVMPVNIREPPLRGVTAMLDALKCQKVVEMAERGFAVALCALGAVVEVGNREQAYSASRALLRPKIVYRASLRSETELTEVAAAVEYLKDGYTRRR